MGHFLVGKAPLLVADATEISTVVDLGLVEGEGLLDTSLTETIAVTQHHLDDIIASLRVLITHFLQGRVGGIIDFPHGVCARLWREGGNHLVGLLINADVEINTAQ